MNATANQPAPRPARPVPADHPQAASPDRIREQLGWRLSQQNWHPR